jgi:hypothetical protein
MLEFQELLNKLAKLFSKQIEDPEIQEIYWETLSYFDIKEVRKAFSFVSKSEEYFPPPVVLKRAAERFIDHTTIMIEDETERTEEEKKWMEECFKYSKLCFKQERTITPDGIRQHMLGVGFSKEYIDRVQQVGVNRWPLVTQDKRDRLSN